jgi:16S rRNA (guanine527-N7)-methyltransferase
MMAKHRQAPRTERETSPSHQAVPDDPTADRARALALVSVSRETLARLDRFVTVLTAWQDRLNLIAASTRPILWTRHIADSLQLMALAPTGRIWADLGSGAGFPGLVVACALADRPDACVHLVEKSAKKASFLREAIRATGAPAVVHAATIVDFVDNPPMGLEVVTARALAPLPALLGLSYALLKPGTVGLFPKGQDVVAELTKATKCWNIEASLVPSLTAAGARIVVVTRASPKAKLGRT